MAVEIRDQDSDIWMWDFARETLTRFTFDKAPDSYPVWTPDGRRLIFSSSRTGPPNVYWQQADGTGSPERLTTTPLRQVPDSVSPDGLQLILTVSSVQTRDDLKLLRLPRPSPTADAARSRISAQLETLRHRQIRHVVLGAFGCGAFGNPADHVARIYREEIALRAAAFSVIAFAVFSAGYGPDNFTPFAEAFRRH